MNMDTERCGVGVQVGVAGRSGSGSCMLHRLYCKT